MKLIGLEKKLEGKFISAYVASYLNLDNKIKQYEFYSRDKNLTMETFKPRNPLGVGIILFSEDGTKTLLLREFRMAANNYVYNFAGGLIDKGEDVKQASIRELYEETGVTLTSFIKILKPSYASAATSDEVMNTVVAYGKGDIRMSDSADEEIMAKWFTKEEARALLESDEMLSVRVQIFLQMWVNS